MNHYKEPARYSLMRYFSRLSSDKPRPPAVQLVSRHKHAREKEGLTNPGAGDWIWRPIAARERVLLPNTSGRKNE